MSGGQEISQDDLRVLAERAGFSLTAEELDSLKPIYEGFANETAMIYKLELGDGDMGVVFAPEWSSSREVRP